MIGFELFYEESLGFKQFFSKKTIVLKSFSFKLYHLRLKFPELIIQLRKVFANDNLL